MNIITTTGDSIIRAGFANKLKTLIFKEIIMTNKPGTNEPSLSVKDKRIWHGDLSKLIG